MFFSGDPGNLSRRGDSVVESEAELIRESECECDFEIMSVDLSLTGICFLAVQCVASAYATTRRTWFILEEYLVYHEEYLNHNDIT